MQPWFANLGKRQVKAPKIYLRDSGHPKSGASREGFALKRADAPQMTPSTRIALDDLALDALYVTYPGERRYRIGERVEAFPLAAIV